MSVDSGVVADMYMDMHEIISRWERAYHASQGRLDRLWNDVTQIRDELVLRQEESREYSFDDLIRDLSDALGLDAP